MSCNANWRYLRGFHNSRNRPVTVARGPVHRERPVGKTARSRCNRLVRGQAHPNYRHLGPTDLTERFGGPPHGEGNPLAGACGIRGPKPYGNPGRFFTVDPFGSGRSRTTVCYRVQARRGTGPRPTVTEPPSSVGQDRLILTRSGAGTPELRSVIGSRHGEGQALALR